MKEVISVPVNEGRLVLPQGEQNKRCRLRKTDLHQELLFFQPGFSHLFRSSFSASTLVQTPCPDSREGTVNIQERERRRDRADEKRFSLLHPEIT